MNQDLGEFFNQSDSNIIKIENATVTFTCVIFMPTASPKAWKKFDYTDLDAPTSQFVQQQTGEIRGLMKRTANDIVEIGQKLVNVKEKLGHGRFGSWLEAEFDWSIQTAKRFMNVAAAFQNQQIVDFDFIAPSALYELAAPSIPDAARNEAFARAKAGESITYKAAKEIKQKYALPSAKLESAPKQEIQPVPQLSSTASNTPPRIKQEIVAIRNPALVAAPPAPSQVVTPATEQALSLPQPSTSTPVDVPGVWWQLGKKHLLYSGDPSSVKFLAHVPERLVLLFAFPSTANWQPLIEAETRIITNKYLPQGKDVRLFEDTLESNVLLYSNVRDIVVSCFMPSIEILSILNRQDRYALIAEPDLKRVNAVISDWKLAGLKAERLVS
ncbi:DUF3102 domain-containing protein [Chlorogloea sp. CCALA 695]|uniref:DUF3102 domain-containing protein n=1 Tax=Chlorogloea sp. CCALA 695 TaxID=2107693 RepID=UPI001304AE2C|nr:DUF3102 domain-containing protein [Chlorogloea sp. CCALA 695]